MTRTTKVTSTAGAARLAWLLPVLTFLWPQPGWGSQAEGKGAAQAGPPPPLSPQICFHDSGTGETELGLAALRAAIKQADENFAPGTVEHLRALERVADACIDQPNRNSRKTAPDLTNLLKRILGLRERHLPVVDSRTVEFTLELASRTRAFLEKDEEAALIYERLLARMNQAPGSPDALVLQVKVELAHTYSLMDKKSEAERLLAEVVSARETALGLDHLETARALRALAELYVGMGRPEQSVPLQKRVLAAFETGLGVDHLETRTAVERLAGTLGTFSEEAVPFYLRLLESEERVFGKTSLKIGDTLLHLALNAEYRGRFDEAEHYYLRHIELLDAAGTANAGVEATLKDLAELYLTQGRHQEAQPLLERVVEGISRRDEEQLYLFDALRLLGNAYRDGGAFPQAEEAYRRAAAVARASAAKDPRTRGLERQVLSELGLSFVRQGRAEQAQRLLDYVLSCGETGSHDGSSGGSGRPNWECTGGPPVAAQIGSAQAQLALGNWSAALTQAQGAYRAWDPAGSNESLRYRGWEAAATLLRAELSHAAARQWAFTGSGVADALAQSIRSARASASSVQVSRFAPAYLRLAADAAKTAGQPDDEVFRLLQESMTDPATASIARTAGRRAAAEAGRGLLELVEERERLVGRLSAALTGVSDAYDQAGEARAADRDRLRAEREAAEARLVEIDGRLRRDLPGYFALIRPQPLTIAETQRLLGPEEALLLVVPTEFGTHITALTPAKVHTTTNNLAPEDIVQLSVARLRWDLGARVAAPEAQIEEWRREERSDRPPSYDRKTAHGLYQQVVAPAAAALRGAKRVYVVAGGALAGLPFSVLVTRPPEGEDHEPAALRATSWFGDAHSLVHLPAVQSLALLRNSAVPKRGEGRTFIGIGDPILAGAPVRRDRQATRGMPARSFAARGTRAPGVLADVGELRQLTRLPGTARELRAVRSLLKAPAGSIFDQQRASEPLVRNLDLSATRILLFSTHGLTSEEATGIGEPGLVLTPPAEATEQDDGYLSASDVTSLRLDADWVILSACNTATGDEQSNLSALARAFFFAGARNILASHWPVSDDVAPILITRTLELERGGVSRSAALQQAAREIRTDRRHAEWAHPFYWAPFILIGEGGG